MNPCARPPGLIAIPPQCRAPARGTAGASEPRTSLQLTTVSPSACGGLSQHLLREQEAPAPYLVNGHRKVACQRLVNGTGAATEARTDHPAARHRGSCARWRRAETRRSVRISAGRVPYVWFPEETSRHWGAGLLHDEAFLPTPRNDDSPTPRGRRMPVAMRQALRFATLDDETAL